jgi:hypothetical protein
MSVQRHRVEHLPPLLARVYDAEQVARAASLVSELEETGEELLEGLKELAAAGKYRAFARVANAMVKGFELRFDLEAERRRRDTQQAQIARKEQRQSAKQSDSVRPPGFDAMIGTLRRLGSAGGDAE